MSFLTEPNGRYNTYNGKNIPKTVKVEYFFHPQYQQEVEIIGKRNFETDKFYLIKFFENVVYIPLWMTDRAYCKTCVVAQKPQCSIQALSNLRMLFDNIAF